MVPPALRACTPALTWMGPIAASLPARQGGILDAVSLFELVNITCAVEDVSQQLRRRNLIDFVAQIVDQTAELPQHGFRGRQFVECNPQ